MEPDDERRDEHAEHEEEPGRLVQRPLGAVAVALPQSAAQDEQRRRGDDGADVGQRLEGADREVVARRRRGAPDDREQHHVEAQLQRSDAAEEPERQRVAEQRPRGVRVGAEPGRPDTGPAGGEHRHDQGQHRRGGQRDHRAPRARDEHADDPAERDHGQLEEREHGAPGDEPPAVERPEQRGDARARREGEGGDEHVGAGCARVARGETDRGDDEHRRDAEREAGRQRRGEQRVGRDRVAADTPHDDHRGAEVGEEPAEHEVGRRGRVAAELGGHELAGRHEHERHGQEPPRGLQHGQRERPACRGPRVGRHAHRREGRGHQRPSRPMTDRTVRPTMRTSRARHWRRR